MDVRTYVSMYKSKCNSISKEYLPQNLRREFRLVRIVKRVKEEIEKLSKCYSSRPLLTQWIGNLANEDALKL